jgi:hypothetical protein
MMQNEAQKLADHGFSAFSQEVVDKINLRLAWAKEICDDYDNPNRLFPIERKNGNHHQMESTVSTSSSAWNAILENISIFMIGLGLGSTMMR